MADRSDPFNEETVVPTDPNAPFAPDLSGFRTALDFNRNLLFGGLLGGGGGGGGGGGKRGGGDVVSRGAGGGGVFGDQGGGIIGNVGDIAGQFGQFAQGFDPVLGAQRDRALNQSRQGLARRGLGGSSIGANEAARINQGFVEQGLARRDQQLGTQAGLLGQQAGLAEGGANLELAIPSIEVAAEAARRSGQGGGGGLTVICTLLHERGHMTEEIYAADCEYGARCVSKDTMAGYLFWAVPFVAQMRKWDWLYNMCRPVAYAWAQHMAFRLGLPGAKRSRFIPLLEIVGVPACAIIGRVVRMRAAWRAWTTYSPPVG